jgi:hypothetical protein
MSTGTHLLEQRELRVAERNNFGKSKVADIPV